MFFKKKIEFGAAMRLAMGASFRRDDERALAALRHDQVLPKQVIDNLIDEMPVLYTVLWLLRFIETIAVRRLAVDEDEFTRLYSLALLLAFQDAGLSEVEAEEARNRVTASLEDFGDAFASAGQHFGPAAAKLLSLSMDQRKSADPEKRIGNMREPYGFACIASATRADPDLNLGNPEHAEQWLSLLHIMQQAHDMQVVAWKSLNREYKLVNT